MRSPSLVAVALLSITGAAHAQTASPSTGAQSSQPQNRSGSDLTRDLNSRPPTIEEYLARPAPEPAPPPSAPPAAAPVPARPAAAPSTAPAPARAAPAPTPPPSSSPKVPASTTPAPAPAASGPEAPSAAAAREAEPTPPAPRTAPLSPSARAALPFTIDLPPRFEIVAIPAPPGAGIYRVRRGERTFVMIYAGPASQFPIYNGEVVRAGGRASVVVNQSDGRHAVEHLFERGSAPQEIHVWTMSLEGAERAMAEQIAQSVDAR